jgi:hypothetical protein
MKCGRSGGPAISMRLGRANFKLVLMAVYKVTPSADVLRREGEVQLLVSQKLRTSIELA